MMSHFKLATVTGEVRVGESIPLGSCDVKRAGTDVTIIAVSLMVHAALEAAERLAASGVSAEVVDVRSLTPIDEEGLLASVRRTGRVVVVDESPLHGGVSSGIAGMIADRGFEYLKAPIRRVARPDTPVPASAPMEEFLVPGPESITAAALSIVG
jgi:pyruvate dehydrogenase E1 component beta subunit